MFDDARLCTLVLAAILGGLLSRSALAGDKESKADIYQRLAVIGASGSAGFGTGRELDGSRKDVRLGHVVELMLESQHGPILTASSELFFLSPEKTGKKILAEAHKFRPTAVIAFDFLFWFAYGSGLDAEERLARLDTGLSYLDELDCPVVVSLLPNMKDSIGRMLRREMVPTPATLRKLNAKITRWARKRKNVVVMPLAETLRALRAGKGIRIGKRKFGPAVLPRLLQDDQLHPTIEGLVFIGALSLETLRRHPKARSKAIYKMDVDRTKKALLDERKKVEEQKALQKREASTSTWRLSVPLVAMEVSHDDGLLPRVSLHLELRRTIRRAGRLLSFPARVVRYGLDRLAGEP